MNDLEKSAAKRILLVEDEPHLAFNLQLNLKAEGYEVEHADNGKIALRKFEELGPFDLVILDIMIPEPNGFEIAEKIRAYDLRTAIIMLTALASDQDKLKGLELGVDDYICKPFHLQELLLRIRRASQRIDLFQKVDDQFGENIFTRGPFSLNTETLELKGPEGTQSLTALESDVLKEFFINYGRVLSRDYLLEKVWGVRGEQETRTVDNFIMRLRKFLEKDPAQPVFLESVRGRGYRLNKLE